MQSISSTLTPLVYLDCDRKGRWDSELIGYRQLVFLEQKKVVRSGGVRNMEVLGTCGRVVIAGRILLPVFCCRGLGGGRNFSKPLERSTETHPGALQIT